MKRRSILQKNKKAMSAMIGYVLLVAGAIVMSSIVYQWIKTYAPKDNLECPPGVSIFIPEAECTFDGTNYTLNFTLKNNGRFDINGYFIHATDSPEQDIATVDLAEHFDSKLQPNKLQSGSAIYFVKPGSNKLVPLTPTEIIETILYDIDKEVFQVELTPLRIQSEEGKDKFVVCGKAKIKENLVCN